MLLAEAPTSRQLPLIHIVEADDLHLERQAEVVWFDVLRRLDYRTFQPIVAKYYEALALFNLQQVPGRIRAPHRLVAPRSPHDGCLSPTALPRPANLCVGS